ncbi:hypothetical protein FPV67DRAFT_1075701 [Lyophyllum atratum]|nr:hypothetical protein FPV67DRAFT_1075701 [Lyophyllum atratum]
MGRPRSGDPALGFAVSCRVYRRECWIPVGFQAPELFEPNEKHKTGLRNTMATDVYAWACVCYEISTACIPSFEHFHDYVAISTIKADARPTWPSPMLEELTIRGLTQDTLSLLNKCWEPDAADRPSIRQVLLRLSTIQQEDHRPPGGWERGPPMREEGLRGSDIPLTLERLEMIPSGEPTPALVGLVGTYQYGSKSPV